MSTTEISLDQSCLDAFQAQLGYIYRTLSRFGMRSPERDDLAQDIFLALRTSWPTYDQSRPIRPYLFGIAHNLVARYRRKRKRDFDGDAFSPPEGAKAPDELMQAREARQAVRAALETVPAPRRTVLVMHEIEEMPVAEIAARMAIPLFTVYSRLRIGRKELSAALRPAAVSAGLK